MKNTNQLSGDYIALANIFSKTYFRESYDAVLKQLEDAKKDRAAKLKAEQEAEAAKAAKLKAEKETKAAKLKAEKEAKAVKLKAEKAAKLKTEKVIYKLHFEQKLSPATIALIVEESEAYINQVIAKMKRT